ncbi:MAG: S41 family peptidase [Muribaculaceae bacterium]|nr:S41 family peptidase [Muribaculaceae bacterium]
MIDNYYVDEVDGDSLATAAIVAMLKTLDPHSTYSTPEETKELNEPLEGKFSGIGVQFNMSTDTVYVVQTITGGPSEKVGIRPGDRIIWAGDSLIAGRKLPNSRVMKILRGPKGSTVLLKVKRAGEPELLEFSVKRDDIPVNSVDGVYMAAPEVGYVRLTRFAESSGEEVANAISDLKRQGMKTLILDLQGNGGGYLGSARDVASLFLDGGDLVVFTRDRQDNVQELRADSKPFFKGDVIVLIDQYSASAAEIVAGALQDNDRATIVGRRSYGKGLVQRPFKLPDGSMIRLTTARYYTPSGRCIQKPYEKGHSEEYRLDMLNRYDSGELWCLDSVRLDKSVEYHTKKGRVVYGGGGVMPDDFVPVDTSLYTPYYRDLMAKSVLPVYAINYVDSHRAELEKQYRNENAFFDSFEVSDQMMAEIVEQAAKEGVEFNQEQYDTSLPLLKAIVKGYLANDIFKGQCYIRAVNPYNPVYVRALELSRP